MPINDPVTNPLGALQEMAVGPAQSLLRRQEDSWNERQAQIGALKQLAMPNEETNSTERWAAMAQAAALHPPVVGGFGQLLASIGGAYGRTLAAQDQRALDRQVAIAKLMDQGMMGQGSMTALTSALLRPIQNFGGVGVNRFTGQTVVPKDFTEKALSYFKDLEKRLQESGDPDATANAMAATNQRFGDLLSNPSIAGSTYAQRPDQAPLPVQGGTGAAKNTEDASLVLKPGTDKEALRRQLSQAEKEAVAAGDYARALDIKKAYALLTQQMPLKVMSKPAMERATTTEKETAKDLADYEKQLTVSNDASNTMLRNLEHLESDAKSANFGAGSAFKTQALKWADTLGISIPDDQRAAMHANQVIGKIALQLATIGAKNISSRPTQLEFQKLLEEGVPATGMTKESFLRVLGLFKETAQAEQAQLSEFMKFKHAMPAGSVSAGDFSDYWALRKDSRYYKLSINDILDTMKERNMTFNQVISKLRERK
jgi:hypothetical protein